MALTGQFLKGVLDTGPCPIRTVAVDSQLGGEFVGSLEADPTDIVGKLVRILLDLGDGLLSVGAVDSHRPPGSDAMLGQEEHDLADFLLLLPTLLIRLTRSWPMPLMWRRKSGAVSKISSVRSL